MTVDVTKEWLYEEYVTKNRKAEDIAQELGCCKQNISYLANTKWGFRKRRRIEKGARIGKLVVVDPYFTKSDSGHPVCLCKCDCGQDFKVKRYALTTGNTSSCGCLRPNQSPEHEHINKRFWKALRTNAKTRDIDLNITIEYIWQLFERQGRKCALSGESITMNVDASLDRIDSAGHYDEGNVQWLHKNVNTMKWDLTTERFLELCEKITTNIQGN